MVLLLWFAFLLHVLSSEKLHSKSIVQSPNHTFFRNRETKKIEKYVQSHNGSFFGAPLFEENIIIDDAEKPSSHEYDIQEIQNAIETDFGTLYTTINEPNTLNILLQARKEVLVETEPNKQDRQKKQKLIQLKSIKGTDGIPATQIIPLATVNYIFEKEFDRIIVVGTKTEGASDGIAILRVITPPVEELKDGRLFDSEIRAQKAQSADITIKQTINLATNQQQPKKNESNEQPEPFVNAYSIDEWKHFAISDDKVNVDARIASPCCFVEHSHNTLFLGIDISVPADAPHPIYALPLLRIRIDEESAKAFELSKASLSELSLYGIPLCEPGSTIRMKKITQLTTSIGRTPHLVCLAQKETNGVVTNHIIVLPLAVTTYSIQTLPSWKSSMNPLMMSIATPYALPAKTFQKLHGKTEQKGYLFHAEQFETSLHAQAMLPHLPAWSEDLCEIRTAGDSIFVGFNKDSESCIFKTTALFDAHGRIINWTDWELFQRYPDTLVDFHVNWHAQRVMPLLTKKISGEQPEQSKSFTKTAANAAFEFSKEGISVIAEGNEQNELILASQKNILCIQWPSTRSNEFPVASCDDNVVQTIKRHSNELTIESSEHRSAESGCITTEWIDCFPSKETIATTLFKAENGKSYLLCLTKHQLYSAQLNISTENSLTEAIINQKNFEWTQVVSNKQIFKKIIQTPIGCFLLARRILYKIVSDENDQLYLKTVYECTTKRNIFDALVFNNVAVLATSDGVIYGAIQEDSPDTAEWKTVTLPFANLIPTELFLLRPSSSYRENKVQDGHLFITCHPLGKEFSSIYRYNFHVDLTDDSQTLISPLVDFKIDTTQYPLFNFGQRCHSFFTDGFQYFIAIDDPKTHLPIMCNLNETVSQRGHTKIDKNMVHKMMPAEIIERAKTSGKNRFALTTLHKHRATGRIFIAGDFGLIIK